VLEINKSQLPVAAEGTYIHEDLSDSKRTPLDYFLASMPPALIKRIRMQFARCKLWGCVTGSKYIVPANFAATGMLRNRFKEIWSLLLFSHQEEVQPYGMSSTDYRWTLVDDFVDDYNCHRVARFKPSEK
jgi:hypothetical protein